MADLLNGVTVVKTEGGLSRLSNNKDNIRGMVLNGGAAAPSGLAFNTGVKLNSKEAAEALGITKTYDADNSVLVHHHIREFFLKNPQGILWLMLVAQSVTLTNMVDKDYVGGCAVRKLQDAAGGEVKRFGIGRNPDGSYTPTITDGYDEDVINAIPKAQALADEMWGSHVQAGIIIEGRSFSGSAASSKDFRTMDSESVSVCIHADLDISQSVSNPQNAYAGIGTILGVSSAARVHENIGWAEKFNVQSAADGSYVNAGFVGGLAINSFTDADLKTLNDKGCIFLRTFTGYDGVYFNDSHTCTEITSDYAYMENIDVINKAAREVYTRLAPKTNSPVKIADDGTLHRSVINTYQAIGNEALNQMLISEEISDAEVYVNPDQSLLQDSKLKVKLRIIPIGAARWIEVEIGFVQRLS